MRKLLGTVLVAAIFAGTAMSANSTELLTNGDFETGTFAGWNSNVQAGSSGNLFIVPNTAGSAPLSGYAHQANGTGGNYFAMTDQSGPGSYSLTQSFVADGVSSIIASFQLFANNQAGSIYSTNPNRDFNAYPNQNVVVDILTGGAGAFTTLSSDIMSSLYGPSSDAPGANPWTTYTSDLGILAAGTYQFRFAETDNQGFFQAGIDNIQISSSATVPEPTSIALLGLGLFGFVAARRRKSSNKSI
jgi:hypothetical protein